MATPLREIFARFGVDFDTRELERGDQKTKEATRSLDVMDETTKAVSGAVKSFGAAIVGVFAAGAFQNMVSNTIRATREIELWGQRLSLNTAEVAAWSRIAEPFGVDIADVADSFKELQVRAQDAVTGGQEYADAFDQIGISTEELGTVVNDNQALMDLFIDRLNGVEDAGKRVFAVDELLNDVGIRMLPIFMQGSERLAELRGQMQQGIGSTIELSERMDEWSIKAARVGSSLENLKATFVLSILPAMERGAEATVDIINKFQQLTEETHLLEAAAVVLGATLVGVAAATAPAWAPIALTIGGVAVVVGTLILILEDLWTTVEGGDSVTRRFIDGLLGVGRTTQIVNNLRQAWVDLKTTLQETARFIAQTPILNTLTGGLFERSLGGSDRRQAELNRQQMTSLGRVEGANLTLGNALGTSYRSRRERNRTTAARAADTREAAELGEFFPGFFETPDAGPQSVQNGGNNVSIGGTSITVNGGGDPREVEERVRRVVQEENDRQARQIEAALVPEGTS